MFPDKAWWFISVLLAFISGSPDWLDFGRLGLDWISTFERVSPTALAAQTADH
jgi:hypothetical protein